MKNLEETFKKLESFVFEIMKTPHYVHNTNKGFSSNKDFRIASYYSKNIKMPATKEEREVKTVKNYPGLSPRYIQINPKIPYGLAQSTEYCRTYQFIKTDLKYLKTQIEKKIIGAVSVWPYFEHLTSEIFCFENDSMKQEESNG